MKDSDHSRSKQRRVCKKAKGVEGVPTFQVRQPQPMQVYAQIEISLRMAHKLHAGSNECSISALDLFYVPPTQTSVEKGIWVDAHLIASVSDTGQIEFEFEGKQQEFLELAHMLLYVTIQLVKSDGSELDGGAKVGPVNLFLHSLLGQFER